MVFVQSGFCSREWDACWDFDIQMDHLISARYLGTYNDIQKKRTYRIVDFAVSGDHRVKLKESKKEG